MVVCLAGSWLLGYMVSCLVTRLLGYLFAWLLGYLLAWLLGLLGYLVCMVTRFYLFTCFAWSYLSYLVTVVT